MPPIARPVAIVLIVAIVIIGYFAATADAPSAPVYNNVQPTTAATSTPLPTALPTPLPIPTAAPTEVVVQAEPTVQPNPCIPNHLTINGMLNNQAGQIINAEIIEAKIINNTLQTPDHQIGFHRDFHPTLTDYPRLGKVSFFGGHVLPVKGIEAPLGNLNAVRPNDDMIINCTDSSSMSIKVQETIIVASEPQYREGDQETFNEAIKRIIENAKGETIIVAACYGKGFTNENGVYSKTHRILVIGRP